MAFAGMNVHAIVLAAVAAWIAGAVWYGALGRPWVAAQGRTMEEFKAQQAARKGTLAASWPFVLSFLAELVMAWVLAGVVGHLGPGQVTIRNGIISALFIWAGFVVTTLAVNNAFAGRKAALTLIDAGHWLVVLLVMGAVIGLMGV
jgi:hypothetical protein